MCRNRKGIEKRPLSPALRKKLNSYDALGVKALFAKRELLLSRAFQET